MYGSSYVRREFGWKMLNKDLNGFKMAAFWNRSASLKKKENRSLVPSEDGPIHLFKGLVYLLYSQLPLFVWLIYKLLHCNQSPVWDKMWCNTLKWKRLQFCYRFSAKMKKAYQETWSETLFALLGHKKNNTVSWFDTCSWRCLAPHELFSKHACLIALVHAA